MIRKIAMRDFVIMLPGIMGSILVDRNGKDLWAPSGQGIWQYLRSLGARIADLELQDDDLNRDVLDDGIRATQLVPDFHMVPGLWKIDGYSGFRNFLMETFELVKGNPDLKNSVPANYFEFAYDWRRDNRFNAIRLQRLIERELPTWQKRFPNARVILIPQGMA